jgi:hypothetical protein
MYVVLEALRTGQHKNIYCGVLRVRKTRYYIKNYSPDRRVVNAEQLKESFWRLLAGCCLPRLVRQRALAPRVSHLYVQYVLSLLPIDYY